MHATIERAIVSTLVNSIRPTLQAVFGLAQKVQTRCIGLCNVGKVRVYIVYSHQTTLFIVCMHEEI